MKYRRMILGRFVIHEERFFLGSFWSFYRLDNGKSYWKHEHTGLTLPSTANEKGGLAETKQVKIPHNSQEDNTLEVSGPVYGDGAA